MAQPESMIPQQPQQLQGEADDDSSPNPGAIRKSTTQGILNALGHASGQQFDTVEGALAYIARNAAQVGTAAQQEPTAAPRGRTTTNDLQEQFAQLQAKLSQKEQALQLKEFEGDIRTIMGDRFDPDLMELSLSKVKAAVQWNTDGTYAIVNSKGQERYSQDGQPLSLQGLVNEIATGNPKLLKQAASNSGSGLRQGGSFAGAAAEGVPDYSRDPAAFNAWASKNGLGKNVGLKGLNVTAHVSTSSRKVL